MTQTPPDSSPLLLRRYKKQQQLTHDLAGTIYAGHDIQLDEAVTIVVFDSKWTDQLKASEAVLSRFRRREPWYLKLLDSDDDSQCSGLIAVFQRLADQSKVDHPELLRANAELASCLDFPEKLLWRKAWVRPDKGQSPELSCLNWLDMLIAGQPIENWPEAVRAEFIEQLDFESELWKTFVEHAPDAARRVQKLLKVDESKAEPEFGIEQGEAEIEQTTASRGIALEVNKEPNLVQAMIAIPALLAVLFLSFVLQNHISPPPEPIRELQASITSSKLSLSQDYVLSGSCNIADAVVFYNGRAFVVDQDQCFAIPVKLSQGLNPILLQVSSPDHEPITVDYEVYCDSYAPVIRVAKTEFPCREMVEITGSISDQSKVRRLRFQGRDLAVDKNGRFEFKTEQPIATHAALIGEDEFGQQSRVRLYFYSDSATARVDDKAIREQNKTANTPFDWSTLSVNSEQTYCFASREFVISGNLTQPAKLMATVMSAKREPIKAETSTDNRFEFTVQLNSGFNRVALVARPKVWRDTKIAPSLSKTITVLVDLEAPKLTVYDMNDRRRIVLTRGSKLRGRITDASPVQLFCDEALIAKKSQNFEVEISEAAKMRGYVLLSAEDGAGHKIRQRLWLAKQEPKTLAEGSSGPGGTRIRILSGGQIDSVKFDAVYESALALFSRYQNIDGTWDQSWHKNNVEELEFSSDQLNAVDISKTELTATILLAFLRHDIGGERGQRPIERAEVKVALKWLVEALERSWSPQLSALYESALLFQCALEVHCLNARLISLTQLQDQWQKFKSCQLATGAFALKPGQSSVSLDELRLQCAILDCVRVCEKLQFSGAKASREALASFFLGQLNELDLTAGSKSDFARRCFVLYGCYFTGVPRNHPKIREGTQQLQAQLQTLRGEQQRMAVAMLFENRNGDWPEVCRKLFRQDQQKRGLLRGAFAKSEARASTATLLNTAQILLGLNIIEFDRTVKSRRSVAQGKPTTRTVPQKLERVLKRWLEQRKHLHCIVCVGKGQIECDECLGYGQKNRVQIGDHVTGEHCNICNGEGVIRCTRCQSRYDFLDPQRVGVMLKEYNYFSAPITNYDWDRLETVEKTQRVIVIDVPLTLATEEGKSRVLEQSEWRYKSGSWRLTKPPTAE